MILSKSKETQTSEKTLKQQWGDFFRILLNPFTFIILALTISLIYFTTLEETQQLPGYIFGTLTVLISIFAGFAGALMLNKWREINEKSILVTRGKSAVRGLNLLMHSINSLEDRVRIHLKRLQDNEPSNVLIKNTYEDIVERCVSLQEATGIAIVEWEDIIPEIREARYTIGAITKLKEEKRIIENELEEYKNKPNEDAQIIKDKESKIKELEDKISEIEREYLSGADPIYIRGNLGSALANYPDSEDKFMNLRSGIGLPNSVCSDCGERFVDLTLAGLSKCPKFDSDNVVRISL